MSATSAVGFHPRSSRTAGANRSICILDTGTLRNRFATASHGFFGQEHKKGDYYRGHFTCKKPCQGFSRYALPSDVKSPETNVDRWRSLEEVDARFVRVHSASMISGVLLDLAGVLYDGKEVIPGATDAVARLHEAGLPVRFVSNTTRSNKESILRQLDRLGFSVAYGELFTPAQVACEWLRQHNRSPYLLVHPDLVAEFHDVAGRDGKAVIVGDAGNSFGYQALNRAFRELIKGADLLALAPNRTFKDADGELSLDAGAFVAALEFASQRSAVVLGKPSPAFFLSALASMHCPIAEAVMVGDDAETDIAGALRTGLAYALLVRTGKYRLGDEDRFNPPPTATVTDISAAVDWIMAARIRKEE